MTRLLRRSEDALAGIALMAMAVLPIAEILLRRTLGVGIPAAIPIVQHLTLWVGFLGAALAAREGKLLALATSTFIPEGRWRATCDGLAATVTAFVCGLLFWGCVDLVWIEAGAESSIGAGIPTWVAMLVLPASFLIIGLRQIGRASAGRTGKFVAGCAMLAGLLVAETHVGRWIEAFDPLAGQPFWPWLALIVAATLVGAPIFAALGGVAALLFMVDGVVPTAVPLETYGLTVSPTLPAIPLFTLAGFVLAEGSSSRRLFDVFRALFGWIPGGTAVVTVAVCAFFTAFTGGSGVTILALGGLLFPALIRERYGERFSLGVLTASGSLGLLFPPSLPLILYGIVAEVPIEDLFVGGLLPGVLLVSLVAVWGVRQGTIAGVERVAFDAGQALTALWRGKYELLVPVIAVGTLFSGWATLAEAAAVTALFTIFIQTVVRGELSLLRDLPRVLRDCVVLLGGVLVILGVAKGLTSWLVDAMVPTRLLDWVQLHIDSPLVFLLALNLFLLMVGCLMDIYSAIIVVVPLIKPLGEAYGIEPVHLGILFVANLELGYLTPPVGLNLFLSSYRFEKPLLVVYRAAVPALVILGGGVLLITYFPPLTMGLLHLMGRG